MHRVQVSRIKIESEPIVSSYCEFNTSSSLLPLSAGKENQVFIFVLAANCAKVK